MIKSKKQMYIVIGAFALVLMLFTSTYAFFNYTRTGASNNIRVGRIFFESKNEETITLNNLFPIDPNNATDMNDPTKVGTYSIDIKGDTDYTDGIEYLVSSVDSNITTLPINLDITVDGLGTENANYFTARDSKNANIYKQIVGDTLVGDGMLLVGYIKPNTQSGTALGVDGSITIKAYLDENKILISDTYDGTESDNMGTPNSMAQGKTVITTTEWNALKNSGVSFKVKVEANEGIWVDDPSTLFNIMKNKAILDNISSEYVTASTGINFGDVSSNTNGKGIYMRAGTENDTYPIIYYRGDVLDNNVRFANKCWKAVRTTDTGGIKLIYNGELREIPLTIPLIKDQDYTVIENNVPYEGYGWEFNSTNNVWQSNDYSNNNYDYYVYNGALTISFSEPGSYGIKYDLYDDGYGYIRIKKGDTYLLDYNTDYEGLFILENISVEDEITIESYSNYNVYGQFQIIELSNERVVSCDNTGVDTHISLSGANSFAFNINNDSPAYVGYMYGDVYTYNSGVTINGAYYGSGFTYANGVYTLTNPSPTKDNTHHYTCNLTTVEGTCATIRYYYYHDNYINLTGGDGIEEALVKMQTNTDDSNAKAQIDAWYASNMSEFTSKLEDTIWCNDRSMGDGNNNGMIANGGDLDTYLYYGSYQRSNRASNSSALKNHPSLVCPNKNDAFTVSNDRGNQKLTYPVALLTEDEMVLAGGVSGDTSTFYLDASDYYWSMSPSSWISSTAYGIRVSYGYVDTNTSLTNSYGLRPSVSLKHGTQVVSGDGTTTNPYIIE